MLLRHVDRSRLCCSSDGWRNGWLRRTHTCKKCVPYGTRSATHKLYNMFSPPEVGRNREWELAYGNNCSSSSSLLLAIKMTHCCGRQIDFSFFSPFFSVCGRNKSYLPLTRIHPFVYYELWCALICESRWTVDFVIIILNWTLVIFLDIVLVGVVLDSSSMRTTCTCSYE